MANETLHRLSVATYNLHGLNQGYNYLEFLCDNHDIVFVQEHWLAPFNLHQLHNVSTKTVCFASSAMDEAISKDCLRLYVVGHLVAWLFLSKIIWLV